MKDLQYYLSLNYKVEITPDEDFDGSTYYIAKYKELDGLIGTGDSSEDALKDLEMAKEGWFDLNLELGRVIPEPIKSEENQSIKLTFRIPNDLNDSVNTYAKNQGLSKNTALTLLVQKGLYEDRVLTNEYQAKEIISNLFGLFNMRFTRGYKKVLDADSLILPINEIEDIENHYVSPNHQALKFT